MDSRNVNRATGKGRVDSLRRAAVGFVAGGLMVITASVVLHQKAVAQESAAVQCIALLRDAIVNRTLRQETYASADTALAEACSQLEQASSGGGAGRVFLDFLGIELSGEERESMRQVLCSRNWTESTLETSLHVATSFLDPQATQIVESCISLAAVGLEDETIVSSDRSRMTVTLRTRNLLPGTTLMVTGFEATGASCTGPLMRKLAPRPDGRTRRVILNTSAMAMTCHRSAEDPAIVILYTNAGSILRELPAPPRPLDPLSAEALLARIADLSATVVSLASQPLILGRANCYWLGGQPHSNDLSAPDGFYVVSVRNADSGHWFGDRLWIQVCQP